MSSSLMWRFPKLEHVNILNILTPMVLEIPDFLKPPLFWGVSLVWQPEISIIWGWLPWPPPTTQRTTRRTTIVAGTTEAAPPMKFTDLGNEHHHFGTCQDPHFWVKFTLLHPKKHVQEYSSFYPTWCHPEMFDFSNFSWQKSLAQMVLPVNYGKLPAVNEESPCSTKALTSVPSYFQLLLTLSLRRSMRWWKPAR